ncbi:MAG TPA: tRNA epoxyqueuosine(34) reductase QueG [Roseiarcus sp.]|nr:tRNA epoxyqueuosine(34) reductase QueG [Roseiarcus sp.]
MVRADQVAAGLSRAPRGKAAGNDAEPGLRRSRLLAGLRAKALELGFDLCRVASADGAPGAAARLREWLQDGRHGDMDWMQETEARRADPRALWPAVRSIVMLGVNYGPTGDPLAALRQKRSAAISVYARNRDYHDLMKGRMKLLAGWLVAAARPDAADVKVFVDTAPVMEKPLAAAAGLGWQGKHTNVVSRQFGSWLFLGALFTDLELPPDAPETDHCGQCRACLDICPTKAFPAPYQLDARRCISYLTIEHKGHIAREFRAAIGNRIYGCDDCLAVCPWNKFATQAQEAKLRARGDLAAPRLVDLAALDDAGFRQLFAGGPIKRLGHARFLRNVLIAIGNSDDKALLGAALARLKHDSPLVRAAAVWAVSRLAAKDVFADLADRYRPDETDEGVVAEWLAAAGEVDGPERV